MATTKAYTDLNQSEKLAEFLPLESADMWYQYIGTSYELSSEKPLYFPMVIRDSETGHDIPCWSLAALFKVISNIFKYNLDYNGTSFILMVGDFEVSNKAAVDACVEMIEKLHEQKLL